MKSNPRSLAHVKSDERVADNTRAKNLPMYPLAFLDFLLFMTRFLRRPFVPIGITFLAFLLGLGRGRIGSESVSIPASSFDRSVAGDARA